MSSSEEYLDNLLKALLENENKAGAEPVKAEQDEGQKDTDTTADMRTEPEKIESNKAMNMDEIEEMFASLGAGVPTGASDAETVSVQDEAVNEEAEELREQTVPEPMIEEESSTAEAEAETWEAPEPEQWALEEENLSEEAEAEPEAWEASEPEQWALEEENLPEEAEAEPEAWEASEPEQWALEEESLPEEAEAEQEAWEAPEPEQWALEEESLSEEAEAEPEVWETSDTENWDIEEDGLSMEPEGELDDWALEEPLLSEGTEEENEFNLENWEMEEDSLPEEREEPELRDWALEEDGLPEEPEVSEFDDWALEEDSLPEEAEEPEEPEATEFKDWALEEDILPKEEPEAIESNDWALEEDSLPEEAEEPEEPEATEFKDWALEEDILPEEEEEPEATGETPESENIAAEEENGLERIMSDKWELEEDIPTDGLEEQDIDSLLSDWDLEEESAAKELAIDDMMAEEEDVVKDLMTEEDVLPDETAAEESAPEELQLDDPETDDLGAADFGLESGEEDAAFQGAMSEEDIDRLLGDDFALQEPAGDDDGLSELLGGMGEDEDLSEINDLLEKADRGLMEDDDMMALLGNPLEDAEENSDAFDFWGQENTEQPRIQEIVPKEAEEKSSRKKDKREKKGRKKSKKEMKGEREQGDTAGKKSVFARFLEFLLEDEEDFPDKGPGELDDGALLGTISDENRELLDELNAEDQKKGKKKKEKKKKEKDPKKKDKAKKAKKPKKPKKEKKAKEAEPGVPEKRISRTKIVFVVLFCTSVAVCILVVNTFIPDHMQKQEARKMYDADQYEEVYELLYGKELNEEEEALFRKSGIILQVQGKLSAYETYDKLGMDTEALNALIEGAERYRMFRADAEQCGVAGELDSLYAQILALLSGNYGVSEADVDTVLSAGDDLTYTEMIYGILNGTGISGGEAEEEQLRIRQDVLPEEEEIIDRLENPEQE